MFIFYFIIIYMNVIFITIAINVFCYSMNKYNLYYLKKQFTLGYKIFITVIFYSIYNI